MGSMTNQLSAMNSLLICFCVLFVMVSIIMGYLMIKDHRRYVSDGADDIEAGTLLGIERAYVFMFISVTAMFMIDLFLLF